MSDLIAHHQTEAVQLIFLGDLTVISPYICKSNIILIIVV